MKQGIFLKPLVISVLSALILCAISVVCLARFSIYNSNQHRQGFLLAFADSVEQNIAGISKEDLLKTEVVKNAMRMPRTPLPGSPHDHPEFPHGPHFGRPFDRHWGEERDEEHHPPPASEGPNREGFAHEPPHPQGEFPHIMTPPPPPHLVFWLLTDKGEVLFSSSDKDAPLPWSAFEKPSAVHQIAIQKRGFFTLSSGAAVVRLDRDSAVYLMVGDSRGPFLGPLLLVQGVITFFTVVSALFISLSFTFYYLRKKSSEARDVLLRLERGDLKARFEIKRFDEFGGLLLDFNRMSSEIERLVTRVHTTEATRNRLLQELGHDLRTPLTSLTTSFENLKFHSEKMSVADRTDAFEMIAAELAYLGDLLDKLMTIATLDEPHYRKSAELISIAELLQTELKARQNSSALQWSLEVDKSRTEDRLMMLGDRHLILRLFKNSFDNAARYAKKQIRVRIQQTVEADQDQLVIKISDDGPGLSESDLSLFGKRREQRVLRRGDHLDISLGLGSVIMKAIVELHSGRIDISNLLAPKTGAELTVVFPLKKESSSSDMKVG